MGFKDLIDAGCANLTVLEELYTAYCQDPKSVDSSWQSFFNQLAEPELSAPKEHSVLYQQKGVEENLDPKVARLVDAYRTYGHLMAKINPIASSPPEEPPQLKLETYGLTRQDLALPCSTFGFFKEERAPLVRLVQALKATYCDKIGVEYMGMQSLEFERWLQKRDRAFRQPAGLDYGAEADDFTGAQELELSEAFLHMKYAGQKRFSLEGAETLISMFAALIEAGSAEEYVWGMLHRGRLNALCNIFNKSYAEVFSEFDESYQPEGSGDVKYHKGFSAERMVRGKKIQLELAPNPSHLEAVDPVVEGLSRMKQRGDPERVLPILVHGDASLAGQGVVYETLQLYKLPGFATGGTLHFVVNNQIGFTTIPADARSTRYCTDIAHAFGAPVFHVNAEDPEGCVYVTLLALQVRQKFHCDVFIDLNCYRKYGHNEGDEPAFTQPATYQMIRKKKSIRVLYGQKLIQEGVVEKYMAEALEAEFKKGLNQALKEIKLKPQKEEAKPEQSDNKVYQTGVDKDLARGGYAFLRHSGRVCDPSQDCPWGKERLEMAKGERPIDWGMAEMLAYASLLWEGKAVRMTGQDSARGTFSHRHAVWIDQTSEFHYYPLQHLKKGQGQFDIYNSPLSENAVLGFEFGYGVAAADTLVIWEAQFGDFANGAQVVIDQFIVPSEQKWG